MKDKRISDLNDEITKDLEAEELSETDQIEINPEKEKELREKANALWVSISNGETKTLPQKVGALLNKFEDTRNSDITLLIRYWRTYHNFTGDTLSIKRLYEYEKLTSVARARAKIQNEFKLFLPNEKVRQYRRGLEEQHKEFELLNKPELPLMHVYADETGKTDDYLIVGSLWILDDKRNGEIKSSLVQWVDENKENFLIPKEFHFKRFPSNGREMDAYKGIFNKVVGMGDFISFKAIGVNKKKLKGMSKQEIMDTLYYQLLRLGSQHEIKRGRIALPKQINYIKDADGDENRLLIEQTTQKIRDGLKAEYKDDLKLNVYMPIESNVEKFVQIADIFAGSLNRTYNYQPKNKDRNAKDELAEYVMNVLQTEVKKYSVDQYKELFEEKENNDMSVFYLFD
ncbi:hypothetical protein P8907_03660 [Bacillus atrophaeus]|uniref:DUF3800 domain-containing protein n=1 Tax=Bacillus atrophaeus TaxID=1452 RepID=UPI00227F6ACD|nr:DUF3800 domain-containing protein [Bacillus atrophaeus]MCY8909126.1 hypothetical protein [Bacillus atrophaeus]MEC0837144.1 hypothetical protein [Bacillus atrophaeus]MEC0845889.1 hypothetical protein [Bacillus atrophaeus]MEC0850904.1 hypothetical protein [Bacillus atrophaeus]MEC0867055.1 hypothetical protein [Bacillus atrophaeus]